MKPLEQKNIYLIVKNLKKNTRWHRHMSFYPPLLRSATLKKFIVGYEMFGETQRNITAKQAVQKIKEML